MSVAITHRLMNQRGILDIVVMLIRLLRNIAMDDFIKATSGTGLLRLAMR